MTTFAFSLIGMVKLETRVSTFISCALLLGNRSHLLISTGMFYLSYLYLYLVGSYLISIIKFPCAPCKFL